MEKQKRYDYLDIAKAIALLVVIYGHTFRESMRANVLWCDLSYIFVYRFHVSLLFIVSGVGYALSAEKNNSISPAQFFQKKMKALLLPWFSYSIVIYLIFALVQLIPPCKAMLSSTSYQLISPIEYIMALLKNENPYSFHLWYLQTLFLFVAVTYLIDRFFSEPAAKKVKILLMLTTPIFYMLFCEKWVWTFKGFFQKFFFFLLGTLLSPQILERHARKFVLVGAGGMIYMLAELFYPPAEHIYDNPLTGIPLGYLDDIAIVFFCLGILGVCVLLRNRLKLLARFGRDTMLYYLYHQPFCCALLGMILYDKLHLSALPTVLLCMTASLVFPTLFRIVNKKLGTSEILKKIGLPS